MCNFSNLLIYSYEEILMVLLHNADMSRNKRWRMKMHLTQESLAEKLGISAAYLGDLERHKGGPSLELFCKTMQTLNISADDYVYPNQL